jgi:CRISPR/Cas system CSM-associated protein Csm4 (group 5 of RAMP superfamily)
MQQALLVRLRPSGPWRYGPSDGALDRVDTLYRSDRLFSAVTLAMRQLGFLDNWLDATVRSQTPAVAFTSLFPFQTDTLFVTPPANLWPPPSSLVNSPSPVFLTKVRWRAAHFVPLSLVDALLTGQSVLADQWIPDPDSGCLLRRDRPSSSPFRTVARAFAPVDRLRLTSVDAAPTACVEFESGSGLWTVARFADDVAHARWNEPLRAAFRLLGDTGFGGGRSKGWGQVQTPEFEDGSWPSLILPKVGRIARNDSHEEQTSRSYWLMSLYSPAAHDTVNWSGGQYELTVRNGRVEASSGALKKSVRMVVEGCILDAAAEPVGTAVDVAPSGFPHPVYRSGIALSLLIPPPKPQSEDRRAIEEIVPPELEATPFPFPVSEPPLVEEPIAEPAPEIVPPESLSEDEPPSIEEPEPSVPQPATEPEPDASEPRIHEPAEEATQATIDEPAEEPKPEILPEDKPPSIEEPEPLVPQPVTEPEPDAPEPGIHEPMKEPIVEVVPEDVAKAEHTKESEAPKQREENGFDI